MTRKEIIIGSRGSKLALYQSGLVAEELRKTNPDLEFQIRRIRTTGDRILKTPLDRMEGQGVFVKELEEALLAGDIDMAVHSLKDVPTELNPELKLGAVGMRIDARDAFVSRTGRKLAELAEGATVGTGSPRRTLQLKSFRRDIQVRPMRGNIDTRLNKLYSGELDGIILAAAAMLRMGMKDRIAEYLSTDYFLPAVGQGALAVEIRTSDSEMDDLVGRINDEDTWRCIQAERAFLSALGGGCQVPIAALGVTSGNTLRLEGLVAGVKTNRILRAETTGSSATPDGIGQSLADILFAEGAQELISEINI